MKRFLIITSLILSLSVLLATAMLASTDGMRKTTYECLGPEFSGVTEGSELLTLDTGNASEGYIMMNYSGSESTVLLQVTVPDASTTYTYPVLSGWQTFPLSCGNGDYIFTILEHLSDDFFAIVYSTTIHVEMADEFRPHLYPNEYVNYSPDSQVFDLGIDLSERSVSDLDFVENVYNYVITNIKYDESKADSNLIYYVPDIDETLTSGQGICFDYASLMAALLRSQGLPTKLVFGYSGTVYHAWISVYLTEYGWVDGIIEFNGSSWNLMDPTLGANNDAEKVGQYIGDGSNYIEKYWY